LLQAPEQRFRRIALPADFDRLHGGRAAGVAEHKIGASASASEVVLEILPNLEIGAFAKEDGEVIAAMKVVI
jgi:hypothetical protein